jgi:hypothetical protein
MIAVSEIPATFSDTAITMNVETAIIQNGWLDAMLGSLGSHQSSKEWNR